MIEMAKKSSSKRAKGPGLEHVGSWAFIVGVVLAVLLGLWGSLGGGDLGGVAPWALAVLVLLGLIVGFLNVTHHEAGSFLWVGTALVLVSWLASELPQDNVFSGVWGADVLSAVVSTLITFVMPALVVVALRAIWKAARHPRK